MSRFFYSIIGVGVSVFLLHTSECTVTVTNEGAFLCGKSAILKCVINPYGGGMTWKLDGTIIAQCAFGSCNPLGALPSGDNFTHNESTGKFFLEIGITHADNGTRYQCDDGTNQDQITVNIQVPPDEKASHSSVTVTNTNLSYTAGCFYPSTDGRMEVYCVTNGNEEPFGHTVSMVPTTTGCTGDCAGPGIFTATGSYTIDTSSGKSMYRVYAYLDGFKNYNVSNDTEPIYNCATTTTTTTTTTATTTDTATPTFPVSFWNTCIIIVVCDVITAFIIL
ncbi:hypothetical protein ACF0H5_019672 [Mactra antiquata]